MAFTWEVVAARDPGRSFERLSWRSASLHRPKSPTCSARCLGSRPSQDRLQSVQHLRPAACCGSDPTRRSLLGWSRWSARTSSHFARLATCRILDLHNFHEIVSRFLASLTVSANSFVFQLDLTLHHLQVVRRSVDDYRSEFFDCVCARDWKL